jgi:hypothetical protein
MERRAFVGAALLLMAGRTLSAEETPKQSSIGSLPVQGFLDFQAQATLALQSASQVSKDAEELLRSHIASVQIDVSTPGDALEKIQREQLEKLVNAQHTVAVFLLKVIVYSKDKVTGTINITREAVETAYNECKMWPICPARG